MNTSSNHNKQPRNLPEAFPHRYYVVNAAWDILSNVILPAQSTTSNQYETTAQDSKVTEHRSPALEQTSGTPHDLDAIKIGREARDAAQSWIPVDESERINL